jgi:replication factor A1
MDVSLLSNGAIKAFIDGHGPPNPRLQVINMKRIQNDKLDRYRIQVSDGMHHHPSMLATQLNSKVLTGELNKFCVIQVEKWIVNIIQGKKILIIISFTVLHNGNDVGGILGKPNTLDVHSIENGGNSGGGGGGGPSYGSKPAQQHHSMMNQPRPPLTSNQPRPQPTFNSAPPQFSAANMGGMGGQQRTPPKSFYGNTPAYTPKGMSNSGLTSSPSQLSERRIVPIDSLNPYQNKWTIKARVISRPNLRTYSNARGEGRVMSVELVDQSVSFPWLPW